MQKYHVNSKEIMLTDDNESILLLLYCILVVFIAQNCILLKVHGEENVENSF